MGKKGTGSGLGKALIKNHTMKHKVKVTTEDFKNHTTDILHYKPQLSSIIDQNSLDEFVQLAELSKKTFVADREVTVVNKKEVLQGSSESASAQKELLNTFLTESNIKNPKYTLLKIPRRPPWKETMSAQEINSQENLAFLHWRKDVANIEENSVNLAITPFEKNLEVWKQLWRVIERSDILLQIVDARNPYFFYSSDLEKYIKEVNDKKQFLLLINKADYLTQELREHWSSYFKQNNVNHIFFSALNEQEKIDKEEDPNSSDEEETLSEEQIEAKKKADAERIAKFLSQVNTQHVFNRNELLEILREKAKMEKKTFSDRLMIGMVGYPNVGKSSVINVLVGKKKVGVASMPGKTKHFQTLNLEGTLCLCDCPGLVFPSFTNSKSEMMCCGVLPIDTMKDFISPISLIIHRVPKEILEQYYKIGLPQQSSRKYTASTFLQVYAAKKGFVNGSGIPNEAQVARLVLRDYVQGKLLFCHLRPDYDKVKHGEVQQSGFGLKTVQEESDDNEIDEDEKEDDAQENENEDKKEEGENQDEDDDSEYDSDEEGEEVKELDSNAETSAQVTRSVKSQKKSGWKGAESLLEEELDKQFFQSEKVKVLKLNKGEKRALKFALRRGVKLDEIADLKAYLEEQVILFNQNKNVRQGTGGRKSNKYERGGNNSNKFYAFTQFEDGNISD